MICFCFVFFQVTCRKGEQLWNTCFSLELFSLGGGSQRTRSEAERVAEIRVLALRSGAQEDQSRPSPARRPEPERTEKRAR